ncbi:MAG: serine/threonine-protein phosphatase [Bacteroidales bacterium]|nr:serine/threonine-protein phosphatase [Bacteroidales bacterium]
MSDITFKMTAATNVGLVRSNNEDNFIVNPDMNYPDKWFVPGNADEVHSLGENGCVMVVADGMGGMNAGEVASDIAVTYIKTAFSKVSDFSKIADCSNHVETFLKKIIVEADAAIKKKVKEDSSTSGMGTTVVLAWIIDGVVHIAWCGDSRAYLFNRQSGLSRLSNDHSYVQELVDSGKLDPELAFDHPNSNVITRSLGDSPVKARPDYVCRRLSAGDYILLCTDGLCGIVRDEQILEVLMQERPGLANYRDALFQASFDEGAYDNVTIALFECISVKERNLASTVSPLEGSSRKKKATSEAASKSEDDEKLDKTQKVKEKSVKSGSIGKKILLFFIFVLVLVGIVAAAFHANIITVDEQKNIHFNVSKVITLVQSAEDSSKVVSDRPDSTMTIKSNPAQ